MAEYYNDFFGDFGGRYVAEILMSPLDELEKSFLKAMSGTDFKKEFNLMARQYTGRPTPLMFAENATKALGGAEIYIKLEGLANTGAHKINNVIGQSLLARQMGKKRIIAETGAGQHG
ncbi:MAG TPA: pyridoxal-phosphate dependent enzyme, partial [Spirochaetales bacterium]|nr:pyridoxal-phosphate dependent enzyme [Spirochaetales bacterium]